MKTTINLTVSLLLLSTTLLVAQRRFGVSITAAPTYAYANTTGTVYVPIITATSTTLEAITLSSKTQTWGYVVGGMGHYAFTPNWSVSTGFWYDRSSTNGIFPFAPGAIPARYISQRLQIPLLLNYRSSLKRLSPYFSVGGLASFSQPTVFRPESTSGLDDAKVRFNQSASYRAMLGAGVAYKINPHLSLIAQPLLIWQFKTSGSYTHYISYQVNGQTQLVYSF